MPYRRYPLVHRKYAYPSLGTSIKSSGQELGKMKPKDNIKKVGEIPMPNELEHISGPETLPDTGPDTFNRSRDESLPYFLKSLLKNIHLEELIIIGIIFILLNEEIRDDILLLAFVYILIA